MISQQPITGLDDLVKKLTALRNDFNGPAINTACMNSAKLVAKEVRKNINRGPSGKLLKAVQAVKGKKAWKYGAVAIARINAWLAPHAHLVEEGTKAFSGLMKIPLAAVSQDWWMNKLTTEQRIQAGKRGYIFINKRTGAVAQHPFQRAVEATIDGIMQIMRDSSKKIVENATR